MRLATFNVESLDLPPRAKLPIEVRAEALRPVLARLDADILCLQEVNGQHVPDRPERVLLALDRVLEGTPYATYERISTSGPDGLGVADVHNLVTLSRFPIRSRREVFHDLVPQPLYRMVTADPRPSEPEPVTFDRPLLAADIELPSGQLLTVINVHLRAPLAAAISGQKLSAFVWRTVGGWAEGYFLASMRRAGQALELRLLLEELFAADPHRLIAVAGDFNAEDYDTALRIAIGAEEDTGNGALSARSLVLLDRAIPADRRWSILHHGRPQMLDHILVSRSLYGHVREIEVHNETLGDELVGFGKGSPSPGSYHAPVVVELAL
ncbi:MAG: endonuclease/exonuclease/phosphatase family protein [Pseudomonadota bacterium]|jgi:endonuclease/exonuclease/phosphatase family metal-dependent hydrolase|nr:MAG: endonuclease [Pseudomonadota bacterium]